MSDASPARNALTGKSLRLIAWILFAGAVLYLLVQAQAELGAVTRTVARVGAQNVVAAILVAVPTLLFQASYHALLLERLSGVGGQRRKVIAAYLQAQVVRYLPGKIWGMLFQSQQLSGSHSPVHVVVANLWQGVMTAILTAGVVASIIAGYWIHPAWLLGLLPTLLVIEWMHRNPSTERFAIDLLSRWLPSAVPAGQLPEAHRLPWTGTMLLAGEWITFVATFCVLLHGVADLAPAALLGVWYAGASLLALAAFVVPAGLAVREAIFLSIPDAVGLDMAALVTTAILARFVQVAAELLTAFSAGLITRLSRHD